jgi:hypothetical protein
MAPNKQGNRMRVGSLRITDTRTNKPNDQRPSYDAAEEAGGSDALDGERKSIANNEQKTKTNRKRQQKQKEKKAKEKTAEEARDGGEPLIQTHKDRALSLHSDRHPVLLDP